MKSLSVEVGGKVHSVNYSVKNGMITVEWNGQTKTTQVGGSPPEALARLMANEVIRIPKL